MRTLTSMISLSMLLVSTVSTAVAQSNTRYTPNQRTVPRAAAPLQAMHVQPGSHLTNDKFSAADYRLVNDGAAFILFCRGGAGLRISVTGLAWSLSSNMAIDFTPSPQAPDQSGRNLQPNECSPADFSLPGHAPTQIRQLVAGDGTVPGFLSLPGEEKLAHDLKAQNQRDGRTWAVLMAEYEDYLKDPSHFWFFRVVDMGEGFFASTMGSSWRPEFYKPPTAAEKYRNMHNRQVTQVASHSGALNAIAASHIGEPPSGAPPPPAANEPPANPPAAAPPPDAQRMPDDRGMPGENFAPPLFDDGAQLWACVDAADNGAACDGLEAAKAFCLAKGYSGALQQQRDGTPGMTIAPARAGIPVRAATGDACTADACEVISDLDCAP